jgi:hypothetical protein
MQEDCERDPWVGKAHSYAGWVPNVRSHLSFSVIGAAEGATAFTQPVSQKTSRIVLAHQRRIVNDYPYHELIARRLYPDIVLHWVLAADTRPTAIPIMTDAGPQAERDRQGMLLGMIYLLPRLPTKAERDAQDEALARIDRQLSRRRDLSDAEVAALRSAVEAALAGSGASIPLKVALMRTGECRIWYEGEPSGMSQTDLDHVAAQAYYFVKDIVHVHAHHDATSDQITPLYPFGRHGHEPGHSDEVAWRRETLWSLSREIERLNREHGLTDLRKSLGIIAYAEAFQSSLMSHVRSQWGKPKFKACTSVHDFDFKHLKDSIKASIDVEATRAGQRVPLTIATVSLMVASCALVSSLVSTHNGSLAKVPTGLAPGSLALGGTDTILPILAWNPFVTAVVMAVVLLGVTSPFVLDGSAGIFNRAQRVLSQFGRALAVSLAPWPPFQYLITLTHTALMALLSLVAIAGCLAILVGAIYL